MDVGTDAAWYSSKLSHRLWDFQAQEACCDCGWWGEWWWTRAASSSSTWAGKAAPSLSLSLCRAHSAYRFHAAVSRTSDFGVAPPPINNCFGVALLRLLFCCFCFVLLWSCPTMVIDHPRLSLAVAEPVRFIAMVLLRVKKALSLYLELSYPSVGWFWNPLCIS